MSQTALAEVSKWSPDQIKLITDTVARGANALELQLFLYRCDKMGLDPLKSGQIHFVKYGTNPGTIIVGIEGFRSLAARTGKLKGIKRGVLRDDKGVCIGGWAKVKRSDWDEAAETEVSLAEYSTGKAGWSKMPETMIQKVAEAAALRMAFPDQLGDAYTQEEMEKPVSGELPRVVPIQPEEGDGVIPPKGFGGDYSPEYGTYARRRLKDQDPKELAAYITRKEAFLVKKPTEKPEWWDEFVENAEMYIAECENGPRDES